MIKEMEKYLQEKLIGKISFEYNMSNNIEKRYDTITIRQETLNNILYYTMCFDHRQDFEDIKSKIDNTIVNSIMNRFLNKAKEVV